MTFEQFCKVLLKRWALIVVCFLFVGLGAYIGSTVFIKPLYQSTATIEVIVRSGGDPLTNDNITASQNLAATEAQLATTKTVLSSVAARFPGLTVDDIAKEVTATSSSGSQLFNINVLDPDPNQAADLANAVANALIQQQQQVTRENPALGSFLVIAQQAQPATSPARPNKLLNTGAGLLTGLLLGILLAVIFEQLDTRVRTPEALAQLLDWPVLASLRRTAGKEGLINAGGYNPNAEAYGILHTNIEFAAIDRPLRTLVVTSSEPGEGKSVVAVNLAIRMAKAGKNTLLIDANLRRPTLHERFGIPAHMKGFTNAILAFKMSAAGNAPASRQPATSVAQIAGNEPSLEPFVQAVAIPNLYVMPSGPLPPNPPELLNSKAMQRFFAALKAYGAEVVIFDTPALLGLSDAAILAAKVDGTLVVVDITRAGKGNLKQAKELLGQAGAHVLGCVVNKQPRRREQAPYSPNYGARELHAEGDYGKRDRSLPGFASPVPPAAPRRDQNEQHTADRYISNHPAPPASSDPNDQTVKIPVDDIRTIEQMNGGNDKKGK